MEKEKRDFFPTLLLRSLGHRAGMNIRLMFKVNTIQTQARENMQVPSMFVKLVYLPTGNTSSFFMYVKQQA